MGVWGACYPRKRRYLDALKRYFWCVAQEEKLCVKGSLIGLSLLCLFLFKWPRRTSTRIYFKFRTVLDITFN